MELEITYECAHAVYVSFYIMLIVILRFMTTFFFYFFSSSELLYLVGQCTAVIYFIPLTLLQTNKSVLDLVLSCVCAVL